MSDYITSLKGKLKVYVFEGERVKPIQGAQVVIEGPNINTKLYTDIWGESVPFELVATRPPLHAGVPAAPVYKVTVSANGYTTKVFDKVEVSLGNIDILEVKLIPSTMTSKIIPASEIEPLRMFHMTNSNRETTPFIAVPMPQYIRVHIAQDSSNPIHKVQFLKYVQNVFCNEFGTNCVPEAIKAGSIAITSYALYFMIHGEYAHKGYDILNTTQNQVYTPNRTVPEKVQKIIQKSFPEYIFDPNDGDVFFAQHKSTSGPGTCVMGHREVCSLAMQNKDYRNIIEHFYKGACYPKPLELRTCRVCIFGGWPEVAPKENFIPGRSYDSLKKLQRILIFIGKNYPDLSASQIRTDGYFSPVTKTAVEKFQKHFNIESTGIIDFITWYNLMLTYYSIFNGK